MGVAKDCRLGGLQGCQDRVYATAAISRALPKYSETMVVTGSTIHKPGKDHGLNVRFL